jgi:hypothetical protein
MCARFVLPTHRFCEVAKVLSKFAAVMRLFTATTFMLAAEASGTEATC